MDLTDKEFWQLERIRQATKKEFDGKTKEELKSFLNENLPLANEIFKRSTKRPTANQLNYIKAIEEYTHVTFHGKTMFEAGEYLDFWSDCLKYKQNPMVYYRERKDRYNKAKKVEAKTNKEDNRTYKPDVFEGNIVNHKKWGRGIVKNVDQSGITVQFDDSEIGLKLLQRESFELGFLKKR